MLGNGNTISLNSGTLNANTTLRVKAIKPGSTCSGFQTDDVPVLFTVPNTTLSVSVNTNIICSGQMATITLANSQSGFNYQLRNNANNASVGNAVSGTGGSITFTTGALTANTAFNLLTTGPAPGSCTAVLGSVVSITVSGIPSVNITNITNTSILTCSTPSIALSASGAVSATGTTQGTGAVLTSMLNVVTSVTASSAEAVVLPSAAIGVAVTVVNTTATALKVFPASGDVINGGSANASITLAPYATYQFVAKDTTNWYTMDNPIVYDSSGNRLN